MPNFVLADGTEVRSAEYLKAADLDLATAAGPHDSSPASGGEGVYNDDTGQLVGGVERLGSLVTTQWIRTPQASG